MAIPSPHLPAPAPPAAWHPAPLPPDATTGGLAFHRLVFARRRRGWWTPLAVGGLGIAMYLVLTVVVLIVVFIAALIDVTLPDRLLALSTNATFDMGDPFILAIMLGTIVIMLPCYVLASRIVNGPRIGLLSSAAGRLRWRWMLLCGAVAAGLSIVLTALTLLVPSDAPASGSGPSALWPVSLLLVLVLVPLQSAAEEYVFRGYLGQAVGRWLRHPAFAILLPVPLFVLGHMYDVLGQIGVGLFAVAAGWLTWRTGGLEAAIALHVVNNLTAFLLALAFGSDPTETETGWVSLLWSFLLIGGYVALVEWLLRRRPLPRTLVLTPPPAPVYAPPPAYPAAPAWPAAPVVPPVP
ncbi:CPBP family intramembrane glutamic endopeptidase [Microbacterium dextranolyticum]|uniref:CAAX prenyl protease 2/Lysostaphin resistance protein A-like domain-containing protein n=1 Tax=Microbacterium dextranolyticum TaxID=36806 RepID=A0A9W6HKZ3_9MICO|nr:type II CAAX endopeptidase family protein [Microbacterium dextranolyticum]MBM7463543.1 membrane protease YdiL (CAAX protease family) [Microbacterium dextranolyticum]GLJ94646.1 hypothetical protein GCM10017591_07070 [Microbacterium dextranolyticum]